MGFAPSSLEASSVPAARNPRTGPLDWHALKSRFLAAHALRRELAEATNGAFSGGSFTDSGADALAALREFAAAVNLTASANGKGLSAIDAHVIDTPTPMTKENYD
ncbi:MAG: hypothetical protein ACKOUT_03110 [Novosphingobium sp.]